MIFSPAIISRFWAKVKRTGPDDCWPWQAGKFDNGYGAFSYSHRKLLRAHRVAYVVSGGSLIGEERVLHRCDNKPRCNSRHLFKGSDLDNIRDRDQKGRQAKGVTAGLTKLTEKQVKYIRKDPRPQRDIADDYEVCKSTIGYIKRRETWKHL